MWPACPLDVSPTRGQRPLGGTTPVGRWPGFPPWLAECGEQSPREEHRARPAYSLVMNEQAAVINVSRYRPVSGKKEELIGPMKAMAAQVSSLEGCFGAQACAVDSDPETIVAISRWASADALRSFTSSAEFKAETERLTPLLDGPAQHESLTPL